MAKWPSDSELEEIYRKGSENHDFEYDPVAWAQMTALLDKRRRRKVVLWFLFGAMIFAGAFLTMKSYTTYLFPTQKPISKIENLESTSEKLSDEDISSSVENIGELTEIKTTQSDISKTLNTESPEQQSARNALGKDQADEKISLAQSYETNNTTTQPSLRGDLNDNVGQKLSEVKLAESSSESLKIDESSSTIQKGKQTSKFNNLSNDFIAGSNEQSTFLGSTTHLSFDKLPLTNFELNSQFELPKPPIPKIIEVIPNESSESNSRFILSALMGIESSWTPNGEFSSLDYNIGVGGSYLLKSKFGLTLKAAYIRDFYTAMAQDYSPPQGFFKSLGVPEYTQATCSMLEVTTGLQYFLGDNPRRGVSLNAGISSNFMLSEKYYYYYTDESKNFTSRWDMENRTWLSTIELAGLYQFPIKDKFSILVGPYTKIPLSGIGHGDVMLSSYGFRLGFNFY